MAVKSDLDLSVVAADGPAWPGDAERLRRLLGAPGNPLLLPPHFLQVTFPKIGGKVMVAGSPEAPQGVGFLFPLPGPAGRQHYLLRFHPVGSRHAVDLGSLASRAADLLAAPLVIPYDPAAPHRFVGDDEPAGAVSIGTPTREEAAAVRALQQEIWGAQPDFLYPEDIHSADFAAARTLVARLQGQAVGFLFGFFAFAGIPLPAAWRRAVRHSVRLESQALGVLPACRGCGVGTALKQAQAAQARSLGSDLVHWTADPLQFGNAVLNFHRLGAVAGHFWTDYYPMKNALNQVSTSRVGITWLVNSRLVRQRSTAAPKGLRDLAVDPLPVGNEGWDLLRLDLTANRIAIEIPARWTEMQASDHSLATRWRQATDTLFQRYLGIEEGRYLLTGVAVRGDRRYLVADRVSYALLEHLGGR